MFRRSVKTVPFVTISSPGEAVATNCPVLEQLAVTLPETDTDAAMKAKFIHVHPGFSDVNAVVIFQTDARVQFFFDSTSLVHRVAIWEPFRAVHVFTWIPSSEWCARPH